MRVRARRAGRVRPENVLFLCLSFVFSFCLFFLAVWFGEAGTLLLRLFEGTKPEALRPTLGDPTMSGYVGLGQGLWFIRNAHHRCHGPLGRRSYQCDKIHMIQSSECWWCGSGERQSRFHLIARCRAWSSQARAMWKRIEMMRWAVMMRWAMMRWAVTMRWAVIVRRIEMLVIGLWG